MSCTTLLVGKNASYDGSTIIARTEDCGPGSFRPKKFAVVQPAEQPRRYRSVLSHVEIDLPDNPMRYTSMPDALDDQGVWGEAGVNEADVAMSATETLTTNERVLADDPLVCLRPAQGRSDQPGYQPEQPGGIGEEDMVTLVLPYVHSAREGVLRLGALLEQYGAYEMNGIAFSDLDEVWWLETVGGHHWTARRLPDDCYATIPNQLGLDRFDLADAFGAQRDHLCSFDLREWMRANHLDLTLRAAGEPAEVFNPREAFGSHSDADHVYNTPRAWDMQRFLSPNACGWNAPGAPERDDLPWCRRPERKVTMEDVKYVLSRHYQGTAYDPYGRLGSEATRGMYRPIGINRQGQTAALQLRPYAPAACRAVQWVAMGSNAFNAFVPFFANVDDVPAYLRDTTGRVTSENFYWVNRIVAALADAQYGACVAHIERYQQKVAARGQALVTETDRIVRERALEYAEACAVLGAANEHIACELRDATDDLLDKVLTEVSLRMHNGFSRADG